MRSECLIAMALAVVAMTVGCQSDAGKAGISSQAASARTAEDTLREPGPDRLADGGLEPGKQMAFGVVFPKAMEVTVREAFRVQADGAVSMSQLVDYVKRQVEGQSRDGVRGVVFDHAVVREKPSSKVRIELKAIGAGARMEVYSLAQRRGPVDAGAEIDGG